MNFPILTPDEMRIVDKKTLKVKGISSLELMEQAVDAMYAHIRERKLIRPNDKVFVFAGTGNNGGDGIGLAGKLLQDGYNVRLVLVGNMESMSEETQAMLENVAIASERILRLSDGKDVESLPDIAAKSVFIDALFGIGLDKEVTGVYADVIRWINRQKAFVISVDIPSGINAENGLKEKHAVRADHTVSIQNFKTGNLLQDALDYSGELVRLDAGIVGDKDFANRFLLADATLQGTLPWRKHHTHKYHYGSVLTIGGSEGMMGAPNLAAEAALRSGTGLSRLALPRDCYDQRAPALSDIMSAPYDDANDFADLPAKTSAVVFGPGMGDIRPIHIEILKRLIQEDVPTLIDADGLKVFKEIMPTIEQCENVILTPHMGEMAKLFDTTPAQVMRNPLYYVNSLIARYGLCVVLKGPCTILADGNVQYFSVKGHPGMATAGSGDVLSGTIARFMHNRSPLEAAKIGVYVHGLAGEYAAEYFGEEGMLASDIIACLPEAVATLKPNDYNSLNE